MNDDEVDEAVMQMIVGDREEAEQRAWDAEAKVESYVHEVARLRQLVIDSADSLEVVESALVARCQRATDDNIDLRSALLELRCVLADLKASGRPTRAIERPQPSIGSVSAGYPCPKDGATLTLMDGGAWCEKCKTVWRETGEVPI